MKLNKIFNVLSVAAVALVATACNDTDAQYSIPDVEAPQFTSVALTEEKPIFFGETTFKVNFDKNINFATKNTEKITVNGTPVKKALVLGADSVLTVTTTLDFCNTVTLHIPAGLILNAQGKTYDQDIDATFNIKELPSNTATEMTKKLGWGWNLGNHFDTSGDAIKNGWGYWDQVMPLPDAPFKTLATAGAKTVRIPVTWTDHMDENRVILSDYIEEVAVAVDMALAAGLNVLLNTHHDSFETDLANAANNEDVAKADSALIVDLWTQVATRFASYGENLIFETFNEVHGGDDWSNGSDAQFDLLNQWNQYAVDAIRKTGGNNATRWIGVSGYAANIDLTIAHLVLPTDPANRIMVGVHCYDPYNFCLAPASSGSDSWGHTATGTSANEEAAIAQLYKLRTAYIEQGIPCYLGEYGCVNQTTERANLFRKYYLEFFCRAANLAGLPMFVWDNNSKDSGDEANGYVDHATGEFIGDATLVPMMIKACTSTDSSYGFQTIWNSAPAAE